MSDSHHQAPRKMSPQRQRILTILVVIFAIIGILWFLYWFIFGRFNIYTDDAYVAGNNIRIMPQIPGTVIAIDADDTQYVKMGQVLIKLDNADTQIALSRAEAELGETARQIRQYYENVQQAQANLNARKADFEKSKLDLERRKGLIGERAVSREELQHYEVAVKNAQAAYQTVQSQYTSALSLVENTTLYQQPSVLRAAVNFKSAYLNFRRTQIVSPVNGFVAKRTVQIGQQVTPGTSLMAIIPLNEVWVEANYKESQLSRLRIGQDVALQADAYGDYVFHGKIVGLSAGTGSAFDLLPPQNATGNWIKIVQRVPVKIALDPEELRTHPLRIGLSMRVTTYTRWLKGDVLSAPRPVKTLYTTNVFDKQLADANEVADRILKSNAPDVSLSK